MRILILELCAVLVAGVFAAMFVALWGTRRSAGRLEHFRQSATAEVVWAAIPCLMLIAAALPAARLIVATPPACQAKAVPAPRPAISFGGGRTQCAAVIPVAATHSQCAWRKVDHGVSLERSGAGSMPCFVNVLAIVPGPTRVREVPRGRLGSANSPRIDSQEPCGQSVRQSSS